MSLTSRVSLRLNGLPRYRQFATRVAAHDRFLYWGSGSHPCWRVMIVLEEKNLPYDDKLLEFSKSQTRPSSTACLRSACRRTQESRSHGIKSKGSGTHLQRWRCCHQRIWGHCDVLRKSIPTDATPTFRSSLEGQSHLQWMA